MMKMTKYNFMTNNLKIKLFLVVIWQALRIIDGKHMSDFALVKDKLKNIYKVKT